MFDSSCQNARGSAIYECVVLRCGTLVVVLWDFLIFYPGVAIFDFAGCGIRLLVSTVHSELRTKMPPELGTPDAKPRTHTPAIAEMGGYDFDDRSQSEAWAWCWLASVAFVVSLYLVPARLRRLPRSDPAQVSVRSLCCASRLRT